MRPLRGFPLAIGVGTDICHIARIHDILRGPRRERFVRRILAPEEREAAAGRLLPLGERPPVAGSEDGRGATAVQRTALWSTAVFVAGRFAAKEAAFKAHALQHRRLGWHDVVIERQRDGSGVPVARIKADEGEGEGEGEDEDESALVSISHDGDYATAVCIACARGQEVAR